MRKNTARKWVHLLLDLLPVLIIPIFAIFTINHETTTLSVERNETIQVDFNQQIDTDFSTNVVSGDSTKGVVSFENDNVVYTSLVAGNSYTNGVKCTLNRIPVGHVFLVKCDLSFSSSTRLGGDIYNQAFVFDLPNNALDNVSYTYVYRGISASYASCYICTRGSGLPSGESFTLYNFNVFDLTQMFGVGNEPTNDEFLNIFNSYYPQVLSQEEFIDIGAVQYDNTDIGSQFVYSLYIPVRDYFNMTNLFNFGDIYTWINNSMFSGNAPLPIFIVYNVIVYEFLIDLIFLIYSIFMFIIDFSSELLARCFSFSNKGGTR